VPLAVPLAVPLVLVVVVTPLAVPLEALPELALDAELVVIVIEGTIWVSVEVMVSEADEEARTSEMSSEGYTSKSNGLSASGACDCGSFRSIGDIGLKLDKYFREMYRRFVGQLQRQPSSLRLSKHWWHIR
jgi:hypothetical protein